MKISKYFASLVPGRLAPIIDNMGPVLYAENIRRAIAARTHLNAESDIMMMMWLIVRKRRHCGDLRCGCSDIHHLLLLLRPPL